MSRTRYTHCDVLCCVLLIIAILFVDDTESINCYKCIALDCPNELSICTSMELYVHRQIKQFYFIEGELPTCPPPHDRNAEWEKLQSTRPTSIPCQGDPKKVEPTCILGRFQIQTQTTETNRNFTSHGSIMGCARPELLHRIRISKDQTSGISSGSSETIAPFDDEENEGPSILSQKPCHTDKVQSHIVNSLQHFMEIEHCSVLSDLCYKDDYCVRPEESVVKQFVTSSYNDAKLSLFVTVVIITFVLLAIIVTAVTFMGIKYG